MKNSNIKFRSSIIIVALLMLGKTLLAQVNSLPGSGTTDDPYRISTVEELKWMRDKINSDNDNYGNKAYKLMYDLNFKEEGDWTPIGNYSSPTVTFRGLFDGNNKKIYAIKIGPSVTPNKFDYAGFFGCISAGKVTNLGVEWTGLYLYSSSSSNVGGITGINAGTIVNCYTSGIISAMSGVKSAYAGGIAGRNSWKITNCYSTGTITAKTDEQANAGGIAGFDQKGIISNCYASGSIESNGYYSFTGGIVGQNSSSTINDCYALNNLITAISGTKNFNANRISIQGNSLSNNYATFNMVVKVGTSATDLIQLTNLTGLNHGFNTEGMPLTLLNNWVKNNSATDGIILNQWKVNSGLNNGFPIFEPAVFVPPVIVPPVTSLPGSGTTADPYRISSVAELKFMRDKVNYDNANYGDKVYKLVADLDFVGETSWLPIGMGLSFKGVFDGRGNTIRNISYDSSTLPANYPFAGLFGNIDGGNVLGLGVEWKSINISNSNSSIAGGIAGFIKKGNVINCYTTGPISSVTVGNAGSPTQSFIGGIVGQNFGQITNCYSIGTVTSSTSPSNSNAKTGGIVGQNFGQVVNCYSLREVTSTSSYNAYAGGIVGSNESSNFDGIAFKGNITNCYASGTVTASAIANYAYTGGIAGTNSGNITNCLALNNAITAIAASSATNANIARVCIYGSSSSFASTTMIVKKGSSTSDLSTVTSFNNSSDGTNLSGQPHTNLNNWVTANPAINGIVSKIWKTDPAINKGFPYFDPTDFNPPTPPTGLGTGSDPYCISTVGNLKWIRDKIKNDQINYVDKFYKLLADLDFADEKDWAPISNLTGNFDGNNKVIRNIRIGTLSLPSKINSAGIFSSLNGSISNLGVEWDGIYITPPQNEISCYAGGIAGKNTGNITNCYSTGTISAYHTGGIAGENGISGIIVNCYTSGKVLAKYVAGGIVASGGGIIENCYSAASVIGYSAGGIFGGQNNLVNNCYALNKNITSIGGEAYRIGQKLNNTITNCFASPLLDIKAGSSESTLTTISNFNDGVSSNSEPLTVLNNWVKKTVITSTGFALNKWKIVNDLNEGNPIFDSQTIEFSPLKGSGTIGDPYLISGVADLWTVTIKVKYENATYGNKAYKLMADLDFAGQGNWLPIGDLGDSISGQPKKTFRGIFDGNGKIIKNLKIGTPSEPSALRYAGFFGCIRGGKVTNLNVNWKGIYLASLSNLYYDVAYIGGIVGQNSGTINNCSSTGVLVPYSVTSYIGGISGENSGTICNCSSSVIAASLNQIQSSSSSQYIASYSYAGGISGKNLGNISNSFSTGSINAHYAGGIVGKNSGSDKANAIITNCYSSCYVTATSDYDRNKNFNAKISVGGISGSNSKGAITHCLALNPVIIGITSSTEPTGSSIYRISPGYNNVSNNYASPAMLVKTGKTENELTDITSFIGLNHGADLYGSPMTLLNEWLNGNPETTGIPNKKWKVIDGINNGLPVFEDQIADRYQSVKLTGSGTSSEPYIIRTIDELYLMRAFVNYNNIIEGKKYFSLISDLDFANQEDWYPIGTSEINPFKGTFDGNGKVIKNIKIGSMEIPANLNNAGLFGYCYGSNVSNIGVRWSIINVTDKSDYYQNGCIGGIIGLVSGGSITNSYTTGIISATGFRPYVGGIVGYGGSNIINCYSSCIISAMEKTLRNSDGNCYAGGIVGGGGGLITNCYFAGSVSAKSLLGNGSALSGGIAGYLYNSKIINCYSSGDVTAIGLKTFACGISGYALNSYCIGLNRKITAISSALPEANVFRIGNVPFENEFLNNFVNPGMEVKLGTSESNLTSLTDFSDIGHGKDLTDQPVTLLNNWVSANPFTEGYANKRWKVVNGVNDGNPIFEDHITTGIDIIGKQKEELAHVNSFQGKIIVEGDNIGQINVFNLSGQLVTQQSVNEYITRINVTQNGFYLVVAYDRTTKKILGSKKVIVAQ